MRLAPPRKKRWRAAGVLMLLIGALVVHGWWVRDTPSSDVYTGKPYYSPDGNYMAVVFTDAGGGAMSPYCFNYVSIAPAALAPVQAYARRFRVYEGACHSAGFIHPAHSVPIMIDAPLLKWRGRHDMEITFDPRRAALGISKFVFRTQAGDERVRISEKRFHETSAPLAYPGQHIDPS